MTRSLALGRPRFALLAPVVITVALVAALSTPARAGGSWVRRADMPLGEQEAGVAKLDGKIYLMGGLERFRAIQVYDPVSDSWVHAAFRLPAPRWGAAATTVNGRILLFGGGSGDFDFLGTRTTYSINPAAGTVTPRRIAPIPLEQAAAVTIPGTNRVLVVGGHNQQESGPRLRATPVYVYDAVHNTWTRKANLPVSVSLFGGTAVAVHGTIYYYGGLADLLSGPISRAVFRYQARSDSWTKVGSMPLGTDVRAQGAVGLDGKIYIVGTDFTNERSVTVSDPATRTWSTGPAIPTTLGPRTVIALSGKIYALGGAYLVQGETLSGTWNWALATSAP
jgi:N-acetylneuraminic acid mutarotase